MIRPNPKSGAEGVSRQGLSVVDSHVHLWDTGLLSYSWLTTNPTINRPHLLADYAKATSGFTIDGMVFVQAEVDVPQAMDEAQWVLDLARKEPRLKGVVPWAPLESGDACRPVLERLSASPLVKGIRRIIEFEPNLDFCVQPGFVKGVRMLAELGLRFDICIKPHQMANTIAMMRRCPDVSFILDHIAKRRTSAAACGSPGRLECGRWRASRGAAARSPGSSPRRTPNAGRWTASGRTSCTPSSPSARTASFLGETGRWWSPPRVTTSGWMRSCRWHRSSRRRSAESSSETMRSRRTAWTCDRWIGSRYTRQRRAIILRGTWLASVSESPEV